jgi:cytochrome P450
VTSNATFGRDMFDDFDIDDPAFNEHFTDVLDEMVARCPVAHSTVGDGYWVINRFQDVRSAGQDWKTFSSAKGFMPNRPEGIPYLYPEECDPPYHTNWRRALNPFFAPNVVAGYEDNVREDARALVASFQRRGECELRADFAGRLPGYAFFRNVIKIPIEDLPEMLDNMDAGIYGPREQRAESFGRSFQYLGAYLQERSQQPPQGDVIDAIAAGVDRDGRPCPFEDKVSIVVDLVQGGIATTTYVIMGAMHHLATHPDDQRRLRDHPERIPQAVEEFVRVFPPVVALGRSVTADVELGGHQFTAGDFVLINYASAARDPQAVSNPTTIDIDRDTVVHAAFGVGPHRCIGSHLARLELRVALEELLNALPEFRLRSGSEPEYETGVLRTMTSLSLEFEPVSPAARET